MKRSTHSDRTAAWAAKQEKDWYKAKIYNPKTKDQETNNSSSTESTETLDQDEADNVL